MKMKEQRARARANLILGCQVLIMAAILFVSIGLAMGALYIAAYGKGG